MSSPTDQIERFRYDGYTIDPRRGEVCCTYSTSSHSFTERYVFGADGDWTNPAVEAAVRILFLLAGVSYYKTTAAPVIDLGTTESRADERSFLTQYYEQGLGEFAYRNGIDLQEIRVVGPQSSGVTGVSYLPLSGRPLIPFGGGIDSIVTVAALGHESDAALCIVHPPGERFAAIEDAAEVTGIPIARIEREIDPAVRRSGEHGFLNGHVPITAVITAAALVKAVLDGRDAVVLSNEWSASAPTLVHADRPVNHQWSKSMEFEEAFNELVAAALGPQVSVFSYLRSRSELWVAQQFAELTEFHSTFRSCNRAFHQDQVERLDQWCGRCDKCCFIDLILSPFMSQAQLQSIFGGDEPLANPELGDRFATLLGLVPDAKPFECVGDVDECRAALALAAHRADRHNSALLQSLHAAVKARTGPIPRTAGELLTPIGTHHIPDHYAPADLLVRAQ